MSTEDEKIPGDKPGNEAKNMAEDAKEATSNFADEAKESAKEFSDSAKEEWNKMTNSTDNKKVLAGLLAIFLGVIGIHKFILGYQKEGVILLVLGLLGFVTCGITSGISWVVGVVEGIIYLTKSDEEFFNTYQAGKKPWF